MACSLDDLDVLEPVFDEHLTDAGIRARRDLVDHRPRIRDLLGILDVAEEIFPGFAERDEFLRVGEDALLHDVAVMRAVVGRLQRDGIGAGLEALQQKPRQLAHREHGAEAAFQVGLIEGVALLGDRERHHLQRRVPENVFQPCPVLRELGPGLQRLGHAADDVLFDRAVRVHDDGQRQIVVRPVGAVDDLVVEAFRDDDAAVIEALVQHLFEDVRLERAEDVSRAEVDPRRLFKRLFFQRFAVELRQMIALFLKRAAAFFCQNVQQFHVALPFCVWCMRATGRSAVFIIHHSGEKSKISAKIRVPYRRISSSFSYRYSQGSPAARKVKPAASVPDFTAVIRVSSDSFTESFRAMDFRIAERVSPT